MFISPLLESMRAGILDCLTHTRHANICWKKEWMKSGWLMSTSAFWLLTIGAHLLRLSLLLLEMVLAFASIWFYPGNVVFPGPQHHCLQGSTIMSYFHGASQLPQETHAGHELQREPQNGVKLWGQHGLWSLRPSPAEPSVQWFLGTELFRDSRTSHGNVLSIVLLS